MAGLGISGNDVFYSNYFNAGLNAGQASASAPLGGFATVQSGTGAMVVQVQAGSCLASGAFYSNAGSYLAITAANGSYSRLDLITASGNGFGYYAGAYYSGTNVVVPPVVSDFEAPLAHVRVGSGVTSITNSNIRDARSFAFVHGQTINSGSIAEASIPHYWLNAGSITTLSGTTVSYTNVSGTNIIGTNVSGTNVVATLTKTTTASGTTATFTTVSGTAGNFSTISGTHNANSVSTGSLNPAILNGTPINPSWHAACFESTGGTWNLNESLAGLGFNVYNANTNNTDNINYTFWVPAGSYNINCIGYQATNYGINNIEVDGAVAGSFDWYDGAAAQFAKRNLTGIGISTGSHTLTIKATNTKNGSSSNNQIRFHSVWLS